MDCNRANELMMDYMDGCLSQEDEFLLKNHIKSCEECRESFELYTQMLDEFSLELDNSMDIPEDFEQSIMQKIENIEPEYLKEKKNNNIVAYTILSILALTFSLFLIVSLNQDVLLANPEQTPILYRYYLFFDNIYNISLNSFNIQVLVEKVTTILPYVVKGIKYVSSIIILCIGLAQYVLYRRKTLKV